MALQAKSRFSAIADVLFGRPLASDEEPEQRIGAAAGIPIFGLDALGSAAYGPEAALTVLLPLGGAAAVYALPLNLAVIILMTIVYFSYRQTIAAYPTGGGSYIVARQNLGARAFRRCAKSERLEYSSPSRSERTLKLIVDGCDATSSLRSSFTKLG